MRSRSTISIDATIDLADIGDDDLIQELKDRKLLGEELSDDLDLIHRAIVEDRKVDALALIERLMRPKFKTINECIAAERGRFDFLFRSERVRK